MTLYDYLSLMEDGYEMTVWDDDYDIEVYFYNTTNVEDLWDKSMVELSKLLEVKKVCTNGVIVNLSKVIESHLEDLNKADLFIECDIDLIMNDIEAIISGNVSEEWMENFVNVLKTYYYEAIETCPHCEEVNIYPMWDTNVRGYIAICEHCGKEIMLCDECMHAEDELNENGCRCDWHKTECGGKCFRGITRE